MHKFCDVCSKESQSPETEFHGVEVSGQFFLTCSKECEDEATGAKKRQPQKVWIVYTEVERWVEDSGKEFPTYHNAVDSVWETRGGAERRKQRLEDGVRGFQNSVVVVECTLGDDKYDPDF